jgi:hypothetical protein
MIRTAPLLFVMLILSNCDGNDYARAMKRMISATNQMTDVLASVKDEATAKSAAGRLHILQLDRDEARKRMEMPNLPPEQIEVIRKKYEADLQAAISSLMKETSRVASVSGGLEAIKAIRPSGI